MKKQSFLIFIIWFSFFNLEAQVKAKSDTSLNLPIIYAGYGVDVPGGDMARRFGFNSELSFGFLYKTKSNLLFGFDASFIWSAQLREDSTILDGLKNSEESVIGEDGQYVLYRLYERGYKFPVLKVGKLIPYALKGSSVNSGFYFLLGAGFMQHKIKIDDQSRTFIQVREDYYKGYDRLTNGIIITENIGYMYVSLKRRLNVFANFEFTQGFTKNRRSYNFDTKMADTKQRFDLLYGLKLGVAIPVYRKMATDYYIY